MRIESLCAKRSREISNEATSEGHKILLRGGYLHQVTGGIFTMSPLGHRVCQNIMKIIRAEMDGIGFQEMAMPVITPAALWRETDRLNQIDILARFQGRGEQDYVIACTHEEICVDFLRAQLESYRQLPIKLYQIQTKFRDELRVRAGLIRVREFLMKDAYSFHESKADLEATYNEVFAAYHRIFQRIGFRHVLDIESDTADMKGSMAHEFMAINDIGEDRIFLCKNCGYRANQEIFDLHKYTTDHCPKCQGALDEKRGIEIGNIFQQDKVYTEAMNCHYRDKDGKTQAPYQGAYGIGVGRAMGSLVEESHDDHGPIWPLALAPFQLQIIVFDDASETLREQAASFYESCSQQGAEVIIDARHNVRVGERLADADLIAAPIRVIFSARHGKNGMAEIQYRSHLRKEDLAKLPTELALDDLGAKIPEILAMMAKLAE